MENERIALVSGGNRAIRWEVCRQLTERGITVVMGSRDEEIGRAAAEGLEGNTIPHQLDVSDARSVEPLASRFTDSWREARPLVILMQIL